MPKTLEQPETTETVNIAKTDLDAILARLAKLESSPNGAIDARVIGDIVAESNAGVAKMLAKRFPEIEERDYNPVTDLNPAGEHAQPRGKGALMFQNAKGQAREVFFNSVLHETQLSPEEIRATNKINDDCEGREGAWSARIEPRGGTLPGGRLVITVNDTSRDARQALPSFYAIVTELAEGPKAVDLPSVVRELEALRARVAAAEAR